MDNIPMDVVMAGTIKNLSAINFLSQFSLLVDVKQKKDAQRLGDAKTK